MFWIVFKNWLIVCLYFIFNVLLFYRFTDRHRFYTVNKTLHGKRLETARDCAIAVGLVKLLRWNVYSPTYLKVA